MSNTIKSAIQALKGRIADAYTAISNKGGTLPATQDSANLPTAIASIPSGGGDYYFHSVTLDTVEENEVVDFSHITISYSFGARSSGSPDNTYLKKFLNIHGVCFGWQNSLASCPNLEEVTFSGLVINASTLYLRGTAVKKWDLTGLSVGPNASGGFLQCWQYNTAITLIGDHTLQEAIDGTIKALDGVFFSFSLSGCSNIDRASVRAVINGLADLTGGTAQTLTLGATLMNKLTAEDIAVATNKNWTLA